MSPALPSEDEVFQVARLLPNPEARSAYLRQVFGQDMERIQRLESLLELAAQEASFLERPAVVMMQTKVHEPVVEAVGSDIGPYKLLEEIGEGGFGVVFMAEQQRPVRRKVALKVIKPGMDSRAVIARFEAERQALALMDHPNIAKVLDAGETASGRPFFVMELVKGLPITKFCDDAHLSTRRRLELFVSVCQATQHAHQKGIIHRDIKPSNVLVTLHDGEPVVKVIDFGVAKATGQQLTEKTLFTGYAQMIGTPMYMSPEQAALSGLDIDTRSDIYSLGVLLYELLTGTTPIERERFQKAAFDEVRRMIREEDPIRPSTRVSSLGASASAICSLRGTEPHKLSQSLRKELDWIVLKSLEKDRVRRYETASAFAADIGRYLRDEQVEACPPSWSYNMAKLYRKHRAAFAFASTLALVLLVGIAAATFFAFKATKAERLAALQRDHAILSQREAEAQRAEAQSQRQQAEVERERAEQEARQAKAVRDFLQQDLLRQASPLHQAEMRQMLGGTFNIENNPSVRELLDRAAARLSPEQIEDRFQAMPLVQAEVLTTVGDTYQFLNEDQRAVELLRRAVEIYQRELGEEHPQTLTAKHSLAITLYYSVDRIEGQRLMEEVYHARTRILGRKHVATFASRDLLSVMKILSKSADALSFAQEHRVEAERIFSQSSKEYAYANHRLAVALSSIGRTSEGIEVLESIQAIPLFHEIPRDHPDLITYFLTLSNMYLSVGRTQDAVNQLKPLFDHLSHLPKSPLPELIAVSSLLVQAQTSAGGKPNEVIPVYEQLIKTAEATGTSEHASTWLIRHELAWRRDMDAGRPEVAIELFRANIPAAAQSPKNLATTHNSIAVCHFRMGNFEQALASYQVALASLLEGLGSDHRSWQAGLLRLEIGETLQKLGRLDEAEEPLLAGYSEMIDHLRSMPPWNRTHLASGRRQILELFAATSRPEEVKAWANTLIPRLESTLTRYLNGNVGQAPPPENMGPRESISTDGLKYVNALALAYLDAEQVEEARRLLAETINRLEATNWRDTDETAIGLLLRVCEAAEKAGYEALSAEIRPRLSDAKK